MNHELQLTVEAFGWSLLHFLWQGIAIAALLAVALVFLRKQAPQWRYAFACLGMIGMLASFGSTLAVQWTKALPVAVAKPSALEPRLVAIDNEMEPGRTGQAAPLLQSNRVKMEPAPPSASTDASSEVKVDRWPSSAAERLRPWLPWLVCGWAAGIVVLSLRLLSGWLCLRKWRASGQELTDGRWRTRFAKLCQRMRLACPVRLLASTSAAVPMVVGWLKPVVLVPTRLFTRMDAAQLEAILAHELAHIRRHDYLVNLIQNIVETLFFFHPAVWWISSEIRKEREHCCDDVAAAESGSAVGLARALATLEDTRSIGSEPSFAVSAAGSSLLDRIRRLLGVPQHGAVATFPWAVGFGVAMLAAGLLVGSNAVSAAPDEKDAKNVPESVTGREATKPSTDANEVRGVSLTDTPKTSDITRFAELYEPDPEHPGNVRKRNGVFFMSLGEVGPWLYYPAGANHYYIEVRPDPDVTKDVVYGPIPGHPVEKLALAQWLRESPRHRDPGYARRVARDMILCGEAKLAMTALDWLGEFPPPSPPGEYDWLIAAIEEHLKRFPDSAVADTARALLTKLQSMALASAKNWDARRKSLPDDQYHPGVPYGDEHTGVVWKPKSESALVIGIGGVEEGAPWRIGDTVTLDVFVCNNSHQPVRFAWTPRLDEGLAIELTDRNGTVYRGRIIPFSTPIFHNHCNLEPVHVLKIKSGAQFVIGKPDDDRGTNHLPVGEPGDYQVRILCDIGIRDWSDVNGAEVVRPAGEWAGTLESKVIPVSILGANRKPAVEIRGNAKAKANPESLSYRGRPVAEWDAMLANTSIRQADREALRALGYGADVVSVPEEAIPMLQALIKSGQPATICRCLGQLRKVESPSDEVLDTVIGVLSRPDLDGNRVRAGYLLEHFAGRADYTVPRLLERLGHGGAKEQQAAAFALGRIGPVAKDALPALEKWRSETSGTLREAIDAAIVAIRGNDDADSR